jgi:hypothetical protein
MPGNVNLDSSEDIPAHDEPQNQLGCLKRKND